MEQKQERQQAICRSHNKRVIQIGSCITCNSPCQICQTKSCIKNHNELESVHNIVTIEYIRNIVDTYLKGDQTKKAYLKKMISEYFTETKRELQKLYHEIYQSVDNFKFDNIILHNEQLRLVELLVQEKYHQVSCSEIAMVLPKIVKCSNFEDGHFIHLRNYLRNETERIPSLFNSMILNLPYFRFHTLNGNDAKKYCQISSDLLRDINHKLDKLSYRPKRLVIKYSNFVIY